MTSSVLFEDFSLQQETFGSVNSDPERDDTLKKQLRASFESGYKEGWIDAQAAMQEETSELNSEIVAALQEAGFAYFEARHHILNSMRPLLEAMIDQVIPVLARDALPNRIIEEILASIEETGPPLRILCAPQIAPALKEILQQHVSFPIDVEIENTLAETQAVLKFTEGQASIDLGTIVSKIKSAVIDFYALNQQEGTSNG